MRGLNTPLSSPSDATVIQSLAPVKGSLGISLKITIGFFLLVDQILKRGRILIVVSIILINGFAHLKTSRTVSWHGLSKSLGSGPAQWRLALP